MSKYSYVYSVPPKNVFGVYSDNLDIDYYVEIDNAESIDRAKRVANRALEKWVEAKENTVEWYKGFVEVVKDALIEAKIPARFYVRMEE